MKERLLKRWKGLPHPVRWVGVLVVGLALIAAGVVFLVLPGPGLLLIALGVAVLASEFTWAELVLNKGKHFWKRFWSWLKLKFNH